MRAAGGVPIFPIATGNTCIRRLAAA